MLDFHTSLSVSPPPSFRTQTFAYPESTAEREEILQGLESRIEDIKSVSSVYWYNHLHLPFFFLNDCFSSHFPLLYDRCWHRLRPSCSSCWCGRWLSCRSGRCGSRNAKRFRWFWISAAPPSLTNAWSLRPGVPLPSCLNCRVLWGRAG